MNMGRIFIGGIVGGVVYTAVSMAVNILMLAGRYEILQGAGILRKDPRLPFMPIYILLLFLVSIGLVWLYAAVRPRLGPGPGTAITVGLLVGLIASIPGNLAQYSWSFVGGFVSMAWTIEVVGGSVLATLAGASLYRE